MLVSWILAGAQTDTAELVAGMKRGHRLGRIPGFHHLSRKVPFARMMNNTDIPIEGWPKTWVVPDQPVPDSAFKRGPLIYKPDDGAQGDGIEIIMSARDLATKLMNKPHPAVVQRCAGNRTPSSSRPPPPPRLFHAV